MPRQAGATITLVGSCVIRRTAKVGSLSFWPMRQGAKAVPPTANRRSITKERAMGTAASRGGMANIVRGEEGDEARKPRPSMRNSISIASSLTQPSVGGAQFGGVHPVPAQHLQHEGLLAALLLANFVAPAPPACGCPGNAGPDQNTGTPADIFAPALDAHQPAEAEITLYRAGDPN